MERCGCGCGWMHCAPHHPIMFISKNIMSQTFNCFLLHVREWKFNKTPKKLLTLLWYYYYYSPRREKGSECTQRLLTQFFFFFFTSGATNLFCLCEELHTPSSLSSTASSIAYVGEKKTCGCSQCTPSVFDLYLRCAAQAREGLLQWISRLEDFRRNSRYLVTLCQSAAPPIKVCYLWAELLLLPRRSLAIIASWSFCC